MKNSEKNTVDEFSVNDYPRGSVPSTESLQRSIIERAKHIPQQVSPEEVARLKRRPGSLFPSFRPIFHSALLASVGLVAVVGLFAISGNDTEVVTDVLSENDLEWQELMLIEDDLLFAQL